MKEILFEKDYNVNSINININKRLGLYGTLGILQDVASIHGEILGLGYEFMAASNSFWVLTQQKLKMTHWPSWQETVRVKTWPRGSSGMKASRDFELFLDDKKIGECVSNFMVIDGNKRKAVRPNLGEEIEKNCPKVVLDFTPQRIDMPTDMTLARTIDVKNSDLDMNNHVNNTKYSQWILDTIPLQFHKSVKLSEFEINFISEAYLEDKIDIFHHDADSNNELLLESFYKGVRHSDGKIIFVAKLKAESIL